MQTLTAQAPTPTEINMQAAVAQTLTAQAPMPTQVNIQLAVMQTLAAQAPTATAVNIQAVVDQVLAAMPTCPPPVAMPAPPSTPVAGQAPEKTPTPATANIAPNSKPQIMFTSVPPKGSSDPVIGKVLGVRPEDYVVALYIRVGGGWWTKPTFAQPTCPISADGTWVCQYVSGGDDANATDIAAYLIPRAYTPPAMNGGPSLPSALEKTAVANAEATR
jgi:hypothetical protein